MVSPDLSPVISPPSTAATDGSETRHSTGFFSAETGVTVTFKRMFSPSESSTSLLLSVSSISLYSFFSALQETEKNAAARITAARIFVQKVLFFVIVPSPPISIVSVAKTLYTRIFRKRHAKLAKTRKKRYTIYYKIMLQLS